jgi:hypothetical protein
MKTRSRALEARLKKLEAVHNPPPVPTYVVRLTREEFELPDAEINALIRARSGGRPVAIMPEKCDSSEEWFERYGKPGLARAAR